MKDMKNILRTVAFAAVGFVALQACTDKNDWDVDQQYDRLFHSTSLTVSAQDDYAAVSFTRMPDTDYYILEYSTDSLYDDVALGGTAHSVVDSTVTTTPDTIRGLTGSTKYWIRIMSRNRSGKSSTWKYPDSRSFTTKAEQIITGVTPYSTTAAVTFTAGKQIDAAWIYAGSDSTRQSVSQAEVEAGALTLTGLQPSTDYTVKLCNGSTVRGSYKFKTTEAYPDGYTVITLSDGDNLNDVLANATADHVVVVFPQGMNYTMPNDETGAAVKPAIPANIKGVYFWGAAGDNKPTLHANDISIAGSEEMDIVKFYNLNLVNENVSGGYIMNIQGAPNVKTIEMEKCDISNTRGVIRVQNLTGASTIGTISFTNCVITDIGSYGVVDAKQGDLTLNAVNITNCTLNRVGQTASRLFNLQCDGCVVTMDHCTVYKSGTSTRQIFDINKKNITVSVSNTLIGPFFDYEDGKTMKGCSVKGKATATTTYYTKDMAWNSGFELGEQLDVTSTELWRDPENGNFTLTDFQKAYQNYGDPRWIEQ